MIFPIFQICPIIFVFVAESTETAETVEEEENAKGNGKRIFCGLRILFF
jgi:hypothetical protein